MVMLSVRRKRQLLRLLALGLTAAAVALVVREFVVPPGSTVDPTANRNTPAGETQVVDSDTAAELPFQEVWEKQLQQVLFDPPPPPPKVVEKPPPPPLNVKLFGTTIDEGGSVAIIQDRQQNLFFRKLGEGVTPSMPDAIIEEILPEAIKVRQEDQITTVNLEQ